MKTFDEKIKNIKLIAFDLDNTLYDETLYFTHSFKIITKYLKNNFGIEPKKAEKTLWRILKKNGKHYHNLFDDFLVEYNLESKNLPKILLLFRSVNKKLFLFPETKKLINILKKKYMLSIITSGMYEVQKNKVKLLGIEKNFEPIIYSSLLKKDKPNKMPFQELIKKTKINAENIVYVGDNPLDDFIAPNNLGMITIRIFNSDFKNIKIKRQNDAQIKIKKISEIKKIFCI